MLGPFCGVVLCVFFSLAVYTRLNAKKKSIGKTALLIPT